MFAKEVGLTVFRAAELHAFFCGEADFIADMGQARVGIVLTQQYAVFCARGEHAVRFVDPLGYKVVDKHTDIGRVSREHHRLQSSYSASGIDSCNEPLTGGFLIAGSAVYLTGEIETGNELAFERMAQLRRVEKVILDSITGAEDVGVGKCRNSCERLDLNVYR